MLQSSQLSKDEVNKATKKLLGEPQDKCNKTGLAPFCQTNPTPPVDSRFWRRKKSSKSAPAPVEQANELVDADEPSAGNESEVTPRQVEPAMSR